MEECGAPAGYSTPSRSNTNTSNAPAAEEEAGEAEEAEEEEEAAEEAAEEAVAAAEGRLRRRRWNPGGAPRCHPVLGPAR